MTSATPADPNGHDLPAASQSPPLPSQGPGGSAAARRPWLVPGITGVLVGLVVGLLVGTYLLGGTGGAGTADGDAAVACEYIESVSDDFDVETMALEDPVLWHLQAIGPLATAAAKADPRYQDFGEQGMDLLNGVARFDMELIASSLEEARESCASF